jgi:LPPG:FO 2-phospho-L-lactate transferase
MTAAAGSAKRSGRVVALCGGVGGAKLAFGLDRILGEDLTVVVNTGDDFEHIGLAVSPDIDTVLYTLGARADKERGWGRAGETWNFMAALAELGGEAWFNLGDRDLALHVWRTHALRSGRTLTEAVGAVARRFGVRASVLPMSDDPVRTIVETDEGALPFQRYFVERRCAPRLRAVRFEGAERARPSAEVAEALESRDLRAVVVCPSNPYLSIDPILAVPGIRDLVEKARAPVVAVSPLIGRAAVKGPTAKIMAELDVAATPAAIAGHYGELLDGLVIDRADEADARALSLAVRATRTLMADDEDRLRLAGETLAFADELRPQARRSA